MRNLLIRFWRLAWSFANAMLRLAVAPISGEANVTTNPKKGDRHGF